MSRYATLVRAIAIVAFSLPTQVLACDVCALANVSAPYKPEAGSWNIAIGEQFTGFDTIRDGTKKIDNTEHQRVESSITQVAAGYDFTDYLSAQAVLPIINRRFSRVFDGQRERGTEAGVGDLTLLARYVPYQHRSEDFTLIPHLFVGVKLPTGNSDKLEEERGEHHHEGEHGGHHAEAKHAGEDHGDEHGGDGDMPMAQSFVHGHDLALGSGSTDVPFGAGLFARYGRAVFEGEFEYCIRTAGSYDYQYADHVLYSAAPGVYLVNDHSMNLALFAELSGENKAKDSGANGMLMTDTARAAVYLGPKLQAAFARGLDTELGVSWPVHYDTSSPQVAATYRIKASLGWRF
jgi:hypothetical protein